MVRIVSNPHDLHAMVDVGGGDVTAVEHGARDVRGPHGCVQTHREGASIEEVGEHVGLYFCVRAVAD